MAKKRPSPRGKDVTSREDSSEGETAHKRTKTDLVRSLNSLPADQFAKKYLDMSLDHPICSIVHKRSAEIASTKLHACLDLIQKTSAHDYEASSIGWRPTEKLKEMADPDMHYMLMQNTTRAAVDDRSSCDGFLSFMLTYDSLPSVPVLYVYEIHIIEQHRKHGLGKHLMELAFAIARRTGMAKVMLTCFVSNHHAFDFYQRLGFKRDIVSPDDRRTRGRVIKADYLIMSKDLDAQKCFNS